MTNWEKHDKWLEETDKAERKLTKNIRAYISIKLDGVNLDGGFTPKELRKIADVVEERINAIEDV